MTMLGTYRVIKKLGEGGMGEVLLGLSPEGVAVVLKVPLHPSEETTARLRDEAQVGFRLRHPHIVRTRDFFMVGHKPVLVIDFVDGASLKDLREDRGPLPPAMVAHIGRQISSALAFIHAATDEQGRPLNMLHRDVTPGNILVNRHGQALLIDLGIARSDENTAGKTSTGMLKGTFRYLCPDLFTGTTYSAGTDLWALGVSLFESAMGRKAATGGQQTVLASIIGGRIMQLREGESLHPLLARTFHALLRTDEPSRRITDAALLEKVFAGLSNTLGDGTAVSQAIMAEQRQGDVSGEFGADDLVPTIVDDDSLATSLLAAPARRAPQPHYPPLPPGVAPPPSLPTLAIDIVVMEDIDLDFSDFDVDVVHASNEGEPTLAMPAFGPFGALPSSAAPLTVVMPASALHALPSVAAPPTVAMPASALLSLHLPSAAAPPTIALPRADWQLPSTSADAPPTVILTSARLSSMAGPATTTKNPAPALRKHPAIVDQPDEDPPRE